MISLLTTNTDLRSIYYELIMFLKGITNTKFLEEKELIYKSKYRKCF
jgi:hypothetical protein